MKMVVVAYLTMGYKAIVLSENSITDSASVIDKLNCTPRENLANQSCPNLLLTTDIVHSERWRAAAQKSTRTWVRRMVPPAPSDPLRRQAEIRRAWSFESERARSAPV